MRVFVGFGYNARDEWIERQVYPVLRGMGFTVVDGKGFHGMVLQPAVQDRIEQSDAAVGFFTVRDGQGEADFTSHIWVRDEMVHANAIKKPIIPVMEENVKVPDGLLGNRHYITLRQNDRLACVTELVEALGLRNIRRLKLDAPDQLRQDLHRWRRSRDFEIRYRTRESATGLESEYRPGRLEELEFGFFYVNVAGVPKGFLVEVEGLLAGDTKFSSAWSSAEAVTVQIA
jgi:hypothetical protein